MENKKTEMNVPEELDDNVLDNVSGGIDFGSERKVSVTCSKCKKTFYVLPIESKASYRCMNCKGTRLVEPAILK